MKELIKRITLIVLFFGAFSVYGQKKESLALLPFTGGDGRDGEAIVSQLARQKVLRDAFVKVTLVTSTTRGFMQFEQKFQRTSGLTDADTVFEAGKNLNAAFVIAGYITKLGDQNLVLVSILDVESLQQIAGDYKTYSTIEEIDKLIPAMAEKLAAAVPRDTSKLPGLSVPPFALSPEVNENDAQVLAQILATDLANGNRYAVLPRTDSLKTVMEEHQRERSGETDQTRVKKLGAGRNAEYVLSGSVEKLGKLNKFATDILHIENGSFVDGYSENYSDFSKGFELIHKLARKLTGDSHDSTPSIASKSRTSSSGSKPVIGNSDFSGGRKVGAAVLNLVGGLGSFTMGDLGGGFTILGGYVAAAGFIAWETTLTYEDNPDFIGAPGTIAFGVAGITILYGFVRPFIYRNMGSTAVAIADNVHIGFAPGGTAVQLSYTARF
jgi:TolB-like protein